MRNTVIENLGSAEKADKYLEELITRIANGEAMLVSMNAMRIYEMVAHYAKTKEKFIL